MIFITNDLCAYYFSECKARTEADMNLKLAKQEALAINSQLQQVRHATYDL